MEEEGVSPNRVTLLAALKACASLAEKGDLSVRSRCLDRGILIHEQAARSQDDLEVAVATSLMDMYTKCGAMVEARGIFEKMERRDSVSWNCIILGYALAGDGSLALELFERMKMEGCVPDSVTYVAALKACSSLAEAEAEAPGLDGKLVKAGSFETGRRIHRQASQGGDESDLFVATTLVDMYAKCGCMAEARSVFGRMEEPSVVSWTAVILGYAQTGECELALQFYARMKQRFCVPDAFTYVAALKACGSLGALERGRRIQADISSAGLQGDVFVANALVDFFGQVGSMGEAEEVFQTISPKNLVSWSALMAGYSFQGNVGRVLELFERMRREQPGIRPDEITFRTILTACSHAGMVDRGKECFEEMAGVFGIRPGLDHYNCMVDLLGRANHLEEAVAMAREMPFEATLVTWTTILGACHKWKDVEAARVAFDAVVAMDPKHAAAYVLMSNIYGFAGMWEEQARVIEMGRRNTIVA
ncbi:pentatricopeptide repeat-containing protein At3g02330, mitochondrial-like [Selaginella moellendorffii]|uniref:pentatricopeptide repeat-containing protein At3g02330, mitochondrial-like n=1 Tax=Selaginella moellendorffii TaxID=88036 RepID=UPI000D1C5D76|nr:pentatricopeptide repeat-containing protein At3g02330, mitochondrial-like [Selaginella moellendorffii]|eukprot:XP_024544684.1 pentatricopeptide repeat-containing protein At3g02330, mitochondrial-like [Selaginella moellendorffii]